MVVVSSWLELFPSVGQRTQPPLPVAYMVRRDCSLTGEEGGDDARSACPSDTLGCTHNTMVGTKGCKTVRWSKSLKPSSVRIEVCNRPHEAGIASNPGSAIPG